MTVERTKENLTRLLERIDGVEGQKERADDIRKLLAEMDADDE